MIERRIMVTFCCIVLRLSVGGWNPDPDMPTDENTSYNWYAGRYISCNDSYQEEEKELADAEWDLISGLVCVGQFEVRCGEACFSDHREWISYPKCHHIVILVVVYSTSPKELFITSWQSSICFPGFPENRILLILFFPPLKSKIVLFVEWIKYFDIGRSYFKKNYWEGILL